MWLARVTDVDVASAAQDVDSRTETMSRGLELVSLQVLEDRMPGNEQKWQAARLIPVTGITGADEQERRGTSVLLAVLGSVREFGRAVTALMDAPAGKIETFVEVEFPLGDGKVRPDGLIQVRRGNRTWSALVEVKTGRNGLQVPQVECYLDVARENGFDAVITISTELPDTPGGHPLTVDKRKLKKVSLHHLSWSEIHTEAIIEKVNNAISDPVQAWILAELIRYLEEPKSGALEFEDMGASWVSVREAVASNTLRPTDKGALEVAGRFAQLVSFAAMHLSQRLGVEVRPAVTRRDRDQAAAHWQAQAAALASAGRLSGALIVPHAIAPIVLEADLKASRIACSVTVPAPRSAHTLTRINWLLRQIKDAPHDLLIQAIPLHARTAGPSRRIGNVQEKPLVLVANSKVDIREFIITLNRPAGTKRGRGRGSFIESALDLVEAFYTSVVQPLKPIVQPAPKVKVAPAEESESDTTSDARAVMPEASTIVQDAGHQGDDASSRQDWNEGPALLTAAGTTSQSDSGASKTPPTTWPLGSSTPV